MYSRRFHIKTTVNTGRKARRLVLLATLLLVLGVFLANAACAGNKHALVIGNSKYQYADYLANPVNDAQAVAAQLQSLGFEVVRGTDTTKSSMTRLLRKFYRKLDSNSIAVFFYAGHGIQVDGKNFLIPINADINNTYEIEYASVELQMILSALNETKPQLTIALIDACRDNPFEKRVQGIKRSVQYRGNGLAPMHDIRGTILSYATEPGSTAIDGYGAHSPYTKSLLQYLSVPNLSVQDMLNEIGLSVLADTNGDQKPWYSSSPIRRFCFGGCQQKTTERSAEQIALAAKPALPSPVAAGTISPGPAASKASVAKTASQTPARLPNEQKTPDTTPPGKPQPKALTVETRIENAIERRDIATLRKIAYLDTAQDEMLKALFKSYIKLVLAKETTRSVNGRLTFTITEAINYRGNRVLPSDKWKTISVVLWKNR